MIKPLLYCLLPIALLVFSCTKKNISESGLRTLDSLDGALGALTKEVSSIDTIQLESALERFATYRFFIHTQVKDTLSPNEASQLKRFFESATVLKSYQSNRERILSRTELLRKQIALLRMDVSKQLHSDEILSTYLDKEKNAVEELTMLMITEQKKFYSSYMTHKLSLPDVENFIRLHNHGELPQLQKDNEKK